MSGRLGTLVFARCGSRRLPGKALLTVGGMPLLERVIRRAGLLPWPVCLATTDAARDDALVDLADRLGVPSFRGPEERVLERAVLAAEAFGLDAFARVCGDRPLFPLEAVREAAAALAAAPGRLPPEPEPDLVTNCLTRRAAPGLTTEVVRTRTLRHILDDGVSPEHQEHLTGHFYAHAADFRILELRQPAVIYACPGFAVDTDTDLANLNRIFAVDAAIDLTAEQADRIYRA